MTLILHNNLNHTCQPLSEQIQPKWRQGAIFASDYLLDFMEGIVVLVQQLLVVGIVEATLKDNVYNT